MFWHDLQQANQRLQGSVVLYDGKPIRFRSIESRNVEVLDIASGDYITVNLEDAKFNDFRQLPKLGFVNTPGKLYWLGRYPARSAIHGHSRSNIQVHSFEKGQVFRSDSNFENLLISNGKYYVESVTGKFPRWDEALDYVTQNQPIAVHHEYAIVRGNDGSDQLWKNKRHIGSVTKKGIFLGKYSLFFREEIRERLGVTDVMEA